MRLSKSEFEYILKTAMFSPDEPHVFDITATRPRVLAVFTKQTLYVASSVESEEGPRTTWIPISLDTYEDLQINTEPHYWFRKNGLVSSTLVDSHLLAAISKPQNKILQTASNYCPPPQVPGFFALGYFESELITMTQTIFAHGTGWNGQTNEFIINEVLNKFQLSTSQHEVRIGQPDGSAPFDEGAYSMPAAAEQDSSGSRWPNLPFSDETVSISSPFENRTSEIETIFTLPKGLVHTSLHEPRATTGLYEIAGLGAQEKRRSDATVEGQTPKIKATTTKRAKRLDETGRYMAVDPRDGHRVSIDTPGAISHREFSQQDHYKVASKTGKRLEETGRYMAVDPVDGQKVAIDAPGAISHREFLRRRHNRVDPKTGEKVPFYAKGAKRSYKWEKATVHRLTGIPVDENDENAVTQASYRVKLHRKKLKNREV